MNAAAAALGGLALFALLSARPADPPPKQTLKKPAAKTFSAKSTKAAPPKSAKPAAKSARTVAAKSARTVAVKSARPPANNTMQASGSRTVKTSRKAPSRRYWVPPPSVEVRKAAFQQVSGSMDAYPETFENAAALVPFFERLYRIKEESPAIHVLHYGDSHTASDDLPHALRQAFQERFGNGGPGFAMPGSPFRGYRRFDLRSWNSRRWTTEGTPLRAGDGLHGLGGVSLTARREGESVSLTVEGDHAELLFLRQPGGGSFDIYLNGEHQGTVDTDGETGPASLELPTGRGPMLYLFRTRSNAPVRLLGSIVQNRAGITWETLGINGAQVSQILDWDPRLLATHVAKRDPAMIVLAYGTNEATSPHWSDADYLSKLRKVVGIFRTLAPAATILLVGPPDCRVRSPGALAAVIEAQRQVAAEFGCAFWDWRSRMGGPGSIRNWVYSGMAQYDHVHLTPAGYQLTGRTLYRDLMGQYERFLRVRTETASVNTRQGN